MESFQNQDSTQSQSRRFSHSQSQMVSTEAPDQIFNKNIEDLKKMRNSKKSFRKIYHIFKRITAENDFYAMNFAIQEKFYDVSDSFGVTIFYRSIREKNFQLTRLLTEFGGSSNCGLVDFNNSDFVRFILKTKHFDVNQALRSASLNSYHDVVKLLLTVPGIDVNATNVFKDTALIGASRYGHHEIVKLLLTVPGIDVNAKNNYNNTALIIASKYGHHEIVKLLLTVPGIDVNAKDWENNTALTLASQNGHHEVIKLLLTVPGIDVNAKDKWENTSLILASREGHNEVIKLLVKVPGIDINAKN